MAAFDTSPCLEQLRGKSTLQHPLTHRNRSHMQQTKRRSHSKDQQYLVSVVPDRYGGVVVKWPSTVDEIRQWP